MLVCHLFENKVEILNNRRHQYSMFLSLMQGEIIWSLRSSSILTVEIRRSVAFYNHKTCHSELIAAVFI